MAYGQKFHEEIEIIVSDTLDFDSLNISNQNKVYIIINFSHDCWSNGYNPELFNKYERMEQNILDRIYMKNVDSVFLESFSGDINVTRFIRNMSNVGFLYVVAQSNIKVKLFGKMNSRNNLQNLGFGSFTKLSVKLKKNNSLGVLNLLFYCDEKVQIYGRNKTIQGINKYDSLSDEEIEKHFLEKIKITSKYFMMDYPEGSKYNRRVKVL